MSRKSIFYAMLDLIFVIIFNVFFFAIGGFKHPASTWVSYAFIHVAYVMILITPLLVRKNSAAPTLSMPLYTISAYYFIIEFVIGLIFIFIGSKSILPALLVQLFIAGIYAALLLTNTIANEYTSDSVEKREAEVYYIKDVASKVKLLIDRIDDKKFNKELETLSDLLAYSPTKSDPSVKMLELSITDTVAELERAVLNGDAEKASEIAKKVASAVDERNRRLRMI